MELAGAKAGRGSKNVHVLVELLKFHTRTRLSVSNRGANATADPITGEGVGVGVGVAVDAISGAVILKVATAETPPMVAKITWLPVGSPGTRTSLEKTPSVSVLGPGDGSTGTVPIFKEETGKNAGKLLPLTVTLEPGALSAGTTEMDAAGTECVAVVVAV